MSDNTPDYNDNLAFPPRHKEFNALDVAKKNQQLKELLKRCRDFINYEVPDHCIDDVLLDKIDEVLK